MNRATLCAAFLGGGGALFAASSQASVVYNYVTDQPSYTVATGQTATVIVYLREMLTGGSTSIISEYGGLIGAGFSATETGGPASPAGLTSVYGSNGSKYGNNFNGFSAVRVGGRSQHMAISEVDNSQNMGPIPNAYDAADNQTDLLELGAFTVVAGANSGATTFLLAPLGYPNYHNARGFAEYTETYSDAGQDGYGYNLDFTDTIGDSTLPYGDPPQYVGITDSGNPLTTFTINVTPEPAAGGLALLGGVPALLIRRRTQRG